MIFLFNPYSSAGGGQRIQIAFKKILSSATDLDISVFTSIRDFIKLLFIHGGRQIIILQSIYAWRSLIVILVIQFINLIKDSDIGLLIIPRGDRLPQSVYDNTVGSPFKKYIYSKIFFLFTKNIDFVFSSQAEARHYLNIQYIRNYFIVPDPNFYPAHFSKMPNNIKVKKFIFLGRLSYEKNIEFIIDIFKQNILRDLNVQLYLYIISTDDEVTNLRKTLHNIENIHVCTPLNTTDQVFEALQSSVVLNPSFYESFGLVPLEAIAAGAGFISSPVGEWQADNSAGRVIALERDAWTNAILDFHSNGIKNDKLDRMETLKKFAPPELELKWANIMKGLLNNE